MKLACELKAKGESLRTIAERLKVPTTTLHRAMRRSEKGSSKQGS
jgi:lambda repressor-like predicted transcriptional regulator